MSNVHFQADLFSEIIQGLKTSMEELAVPAEHVVDLATKIYISLSKKSESGAAGDTTFYIANQERRTVNCLGVIKCKECGHEEGKFIGQEIKYCAGCGRKVREKK